MFSSIDDSIQHSQKGRITELELIRVSATAMVLLGHLVTMEALNDRLGPARFLFVYGHEAVIAFFTLSGVVNRYSFVRAGQTGRQLIVARAIRLLPIYVVVLIVTTCIQAWADRAVPVVKFVGHVLLLVKLQGDVIKPMSVNPALWSMSYEFFFYGIFALVVSLKRKAPYVVWMLAGLAAVVFEQICCPKGYAAWLAKLFGYSIAWLIGFCLPEIQARIRFPNWTVSALLGVVPAFTNLGLPREQSLWVVVTSVILCPVLIEASSRTSSASTTQKFLGGFIGGVGVSVIVVSLWISGQPERRTVPLTICVFVCSALASQVGHAAIHACRRFSEAIKVGGRASYTIYLTHMAFIFVMNNTSIPVFCQILSVLGAVVGSVLLLEWWFQPIVTRFVARMCR